MKRKEEFVTRKVGDCMILVPTGSRVLDLNGLLSLNDTALFIWEHLDGRHSLEEIAQGLTEKFEVKEDEAVLGVEAFIRDAQQMGLLE